MAAFSFGQPLQATRTIPLIHINPASRLKQSLPCRSHLSGGPTGSGEEKEKEGRSTRMGKRWWGLLVEIYSETGKLGRGLKESLSPKQKGDWKDLVLMSFSFALYVYISQQIVCAYCAWMSMINHP